MFLAHSNDDRSWRQIAFHVMMAALWGALIGVSVLVSPLIVPLLIMVAALVYFLLPRPVLACSILIVVTVFTSAMPRGKLVPLFAPNELMLIGSVALLALLLVVRRDERPLVGTVTAGGLILILVTVLIPIVSFSMRGYRFDLETVFKMAAPFQYLLLFWLFSTAPRNDGDRARLLQLMFLSASLVALIGLLQAANIQPVVDFILAWFPSDQAAAAGRLGRITSVFGAWNTLGTYLMTNVMLLAAFQRETTVRVYRVNMGISAVLSLLALLASGSYASLLGLVLGIGIIKALDPRGLRAAVPMLVVGLIGLVMLFPLISERFAFQFERSESGWIPQTLEFRLKVWRDIYLPLIARNPIWGVQPTLDGISFEHAESQYLLLLFRSGWISLVGFLIWVGTLLAWSGMIIRGERNSMRVGAIFVFALAMTLLVMGLTNPVFTYSGTVDYMWMMLGLIASKQKGKLHVAG